MDHGPVVTLPEQFKSNVTEGQKVILGFRADNLMPVGHSMPMEGDYAEFEMTVSLSEPLGTETLLFGRLAEMEVQAKMLNPRPVMADERLQFQLDLTRCHLFDAETQKSLR